MNAEVPEVTEDESFLTSLRGMILDTGFPSSPTDFPPFIHCWFHHFTSEVQIELLGNDIRMNFESLVANPLKNMFSL
jgi:hypothetical protein